MKPTRLTRVRSLLLGALLSLGCSCANTALVEQEDAAAPRDRGWQGLEQCVEAKPAEIEIEAIRTPTPESDCDS